MTPCRHRTGTIAFDDAGRPVRHAWRCDWPDAYPDRLAGYPIWMIRQCGGGQLVTQHECDTCEAKEPPK